MPGEDSFDPKSWARPSPEGGAPAGGSALPDAWKAVADERAAGHTTAHSAPRAVASGDRSAVLPLLISGLLLIGGAGGAWVMRAPHDPAATPLAGAAASAIPEVPGQQVSSRTLVLAGAADLAAALVAAGLSPPEAAAANAAAMRVLGGASGEIHAVLNLVTLPEGVHLQRLEASFADGSGAVVSAAGAGKFTASRVAAELSKRIQVVSGELDTNSFYSSAVAAGVTDSLIPEFVNAFTFDFNLAAEVSPGDTFEVAYEQTVNAKGDPVGATQLLYASLVTAEKRRALYRFKPADQDVGWFDGNGASTVRSFMKTPVDGARITSNFGPRFHPVLRYTRLHGGTDFAAPVGTPIYSAADGTVVSASPSRCAGNMAIIRHDNGYETRYFHLSRYADGLRAGQPVKQGFTIGDVGNTGTCTTGPHLHYEVHINGQKVDPLSIKTDSGRKGLEGASLAAFIQQRDRVDVARARQAQ